MIYHVTSQSNGDIFTCDVNMLFSHMKISSFHAKAHLVFHWWTYIWYQIGLFLTFGLDLIQVILWYYWWILQPILWTWSTPQWSCRWEDIYWTFRCVMIFGQHILKNYHNQSCIVLHKITLLLKCVLNGIINKDLKIWGLKDIWIREDGGSVHERRKVQ